MRGRAAFDQQTFMSYVSCWFLDKINKYEIVLKICFLKKQQFLQSPEATVPHTWLHICDQIYLTKAKNLQDRSFHLET